MAAALPAVPLAGLPAQARDGLFWAYDFDAHAYYRLRATLVHASDISRIYVEAGHWASPAAITDIAETFEDRIYPKLRNRFGHEPIPGIDGQRAITLLLLDIRDPLAAGRPPYTYYAGYFDPTNQYPQTQLDADPSLAGRKSNEAEMIYLDIRPTVAGSLTQLQTLAHEFTHLITWAYDPDEEMWISEGLSELAVHVAGLGHPAEHVRAFLARPTGSLDTWDGRDTDYGRVYLFMLYLFELSERLARSGDVVAAAWPRSLVADPATGWEGLTNSLPGERSVAETFRDWAVTLHVNDPSLEDGRFGYANLTLGAETLGANRFPALASVTRNTFPFVDARVFLPPWSLASEHWVGGPGLLDISLAAEEPFCATLITWPSYRRPANGKSHLRSACVATALPGLGWTVESFRSGGTTPSLHWVVANASEQALDLTVSAVPPVGATRWYPPAFLPRALR